jgi:restriction endonuclease S subunit
MKKIKEILMNGVQPSIKVPHLLNVQIPLPITLAEQEKIAEVLSIAL